MAIAVGRPGRGWRGSASRPWGGRWSPRCRSAWPAPRGRSASTPVEASASSTSSPIARNSSQVSTGVVDFRGAPHRHDPLQVRAARGGPPAPCAAAPCSRRGSPAPRSGALMYRPPRASRWCRSRPGHRRRHAARSRITHSGRLKPRMVVLAGLETEGHQRPGGLCHLVGVGPPVRGLPSPTLAHIVRGLVRGALRALEESIPNSVNSHSIASWVLGRSWAGPRNMSANSRRRKGPRPDAVLSPPIHGGVAERSKAADLKSVAGPTLPGVRIPPPPPKGHPNPRQRQRQRQRQCPLPERSKLNPGRLLVCTDQLLSASWGQRQSELEGARQMDTCTFWSLPWPYFVLVVIVGLIEPQLH